MKKWQLFMLFILLCTSKVFAQQDKIFTQYLNYPASINPAYVGSTGGSQLMLIYRDQWSNFDGAPKSAVLSANTLLKRYNVGVGLTVDYDQIGEERTTEASLDLSYRLHLAKETHLQFGVKSGFSSYSIAYSKLQLSDNISDPTVAHDIEGEKEFNVGVGFYLINPRYYVGLSSPKLIEKTKANIEGTDSDNKAKSLQRHYYFMAGYLFDINPNLKLWPSTMVRMTAGAPISFDIRAILVIYDKIWFGPSYRYDNSVSAIVQYQLTNQLRLGYSYDLMTTELSSYAGNTHEFTLRYDFNLPVRKLKSPRYF